MTEKLVTMLLIVFTLFNLNAVVDGGNCRTSAPEVSLHQMIRQCDGTSMVRTNKCAAGYHRFCGRVTPKKKLFGVSREYIDNVAGISCVEARWSGDVRVSTLKRHHRLCNSEAMLQSRRCYSAIHRFCKAKFGNEYAGISQEHSRGKALIYCFKAARKLNVRMRVLTETVSRCNKDDHIDSGPCFSAVSRFCQRYYNLGGGIPLEHNSKSIEIACYEAYWSGDVHFRKHSDLYRKRKEIRSVCKFSFFVDQGKILSTTPDVLEEKFYDNKGSNTTWLYDTFKFTKKRSYTTTFQHSHSFTISASTTVKTGVPFVAEGKVTLSASYTGSFSLGKSETREETYTRSSPVKVPPGVAIRVSAVLTKAKLDVPWRAEAINGLGARKIIRGTWRGVSTYDLKVVQREV